jgi:tetratricopeptide (TPR) repeat protein
MQIAKDHDFKEIMSSDFRLMGVIESLNENYEIADTLFNKSLALAEEVEDPQKIGGAYFSMAKSFYARGFIEKAIDYFSIALKSFEDSNMETLARKTRLEMQAVVDSKISD